jgi:ankyrin repeat protein
MTRETTDLQAFRDAVLRRDVQSVSTLLEHPHVRAHIDDPLFDFGQRAAHMAAHDEAMLTVLLDAGADITLKSEWANGPYTVLDRATDHTARFLLSRGAALTPNVAARLGWFDELRALLDAEPALVHARGGDGQTPLHEAANVAVADLLLDRGADIDARCIDHRATPAQYALVDRSDVCRRLLHRGAAPDIFMAAHLGDAALTLRLIDADPACVTARIHSPGYAPVPPMHIYCWTLGFDRSPHEVAAAAGHDEVRDLLMERSPAHVDRLAVAIFHEQFDAAHAMLDRGADPSVPGVDGGSALHAACWVGNVPMVERLLATGAVPIDSRDPTHRSTPLGWTAFGSVHRRAKDGDYPAVAERLVAAGADVTLAGNGAGRSLLEMAEGNEVMQNALRRLGAF